jgi:hypothetical protein
MRASLVAGALAAAAALAGCAAIPDDQKRNAINEVNAEFRSQYERILAEQGTRFYRVSPEEAFDTLRVTLTRMGMRIGDQSPSIGYLNVFAPAPTPLDQDEWLKAEAQDLPKLREIAVKHVGLRGNLIRFEPEGLEIVINGTTLAARSGTEISLTVRLREVKPPQSGMPRRDYAPPSAVRMGLDKIWRNFEQELRTVRAL